MKIRILDGFFPPFPKHKAQLPTSGMQYTAELLLKPMPQYEARAGTFSFTLARETLEGEQN